MSVKRGFKQTEVGVIPEDWEYRAVSGLAARKANSIVGGPFGSDLVSSDYVNAGVPVIRGQNMGQRFISGEFVFVSTEKARLLKANTAAPKDMVFTQRGTLGQVSIVPEGGFESYLISQSQMKLSVDTQAHDPVYLWQYFMGGHGQKQILDSAIQTGVPHTNLGILKSYRVPLPPTLTEQQAIAEALSDADALIEGLESLIAKKRAIKQGAMQDLLTSKRRLPGFKGEWETKRLGSEIADLVAGVSVNSVVGEVDSRSGAKAILKTSAVSGGYFKAWEAKIIALTDLHRVHLFPEADNVLISRMNTIDLVGECGYVGENFPNLFIPDRLWMTRFRQNAQLSARWLAFIMCTPSARQFLKNIASGTSGSMKNISKSAILALEFLIPALPEQSAIAAVLTDMDAELETLDAKLVKARAIKQGMIQELLTGRIRLI